MYNVYFVWRFPKRLGRARRAPIAIAMTIANAYEAYCHEKGFTLEFSDGILGGMLWEY